jgi:hypothetical protein
MSDHFFSLEEEEEEETQRTFQYKHFNTFFKNSSCKKSFSKNNEPCKNSCYCFICCTAYLDCNCDSCSKIKFPCVHKKINCSCDICKKIPHSVPETLPIFKRLELDEGYKYQTIQYYYPEMAKFNSKILRSEIQGASTIATHFARERFSNEHLEKLGIDSKLKNEFDRSGLLPNFNGNLKAWEEHEKITNAIENFRKKYHRYPPCFKERSSIRSITKVSIFFQRFFIHFNKKLII